MPFTKLGLSDPLLRAIADAGYTTPSPIQLQAIPAVLNGHDLLAAAQTGTGKTAGFALPILHRLSQHNYGANRPVRVLILTPTRELAAQVGESVTKYGAHLHPRLKTEIVFGGVKINPQMMRLRGGVDVLVATPGRLLDLVGQNALKLDKVETLVLDEADRMLDMGFSEDVLTIINTCNTQKQTLLFSATLSHSGVIKMANKVLTNYGTIVLNSLQDGHRNIEQQIVLADDGDHKQKLLAWLLLNESYDKALVFTNTRLNADALRGPLRGQKLRVGVLHGEMDQKDRNRMMELFRDGSVNIMIATDLAARGLDIKGINLVINFDVPRNGINYVHRIGRTGRVDELGLAITLVKHTEWNLMSGIERFLKQKFTRKNIKELQGSYKGPKKTKGSGKSVGSKTKIEPKKVAPEKIKVRHRDAKNVGKRRVPTNTPLATDQVTDQESES